MVYDASIPSLCKGDDGFNNGFMNSIFMNVFYKRTIDFDEVSLEFHKVFKV